MVLQRVTQSRYPLALELIIILGSRLPYGFYVFKVAKLSPDVNPLASMLCIRYGINPLMSVFWETPSTPR